MTILKNNLNGFANVCLLPEIICFATKAGFVNKKENVFLILES